MRLPTHRSPTHPGEMLFEEFLKPYGLTQTELAKRIGVSYVRVNELVRGKRGITPDTALRLSKFFGTSPELWLNLQLKWDLWQLLNSEAAREIDRIKPY
jgi:antitoxin HigA-1